MIQDYSGSKEKKRKMKSGFQPRNKREKIIGPLAVLIMVIVVIILLWTQGVINFGSRKGEVEQNTELERLYEFIGEERLGSIKTMIDLRLKSEVNEETIIKIANKLRKDGRSHYQRVFINYYLPGMEVGKGAWALSHFNPDLEVEIMGLSKDEKAELFDKPSSYEGTLIGRWLDTSPYSGGMISISKNEENLKIYKKYSDGSESVKNLIEKTVNGQKRWNEEGNDFGEYYILNNDGDLSIYDTEGLIRKIPKVK